MKKFLIFTILIMGIIFYGCDKDSSTEPAADNSDIPTDPGITPPTPVQNNVQPTAAFTPTLDNPQRIQVNLQGVLHPGTNQPISFYYDQNNPSNSNIFLTQDGVCKGLVVTKVGTGNILQADLVFTVDNSGSMYQEADSVAASIISFANLLAASGLEVHFGIVGYKYGPVNGALDFATAQQLEAYLTTRTDYWGNPVTGTDRTEGFATSTLLGSVADSAALANRAYNFARGINGTSAENGVVGVLFADSMFSWRSGAQRVFINFTDEPTQSNGIKWNHAHMCGLISGKATVHSVFSEDTTYWTWNAQNERPWKMSECTGGTVKFINESATGLDLSTLPVTGALTNSYLVEYFNPDTQFKQHTVVIIVYEQGADGQRAYTVSY